MRGMPRMASRAIRCPMDAMEHPGQKERMDAGSVSLGWMTPITTGGRAAVVGQVGPRRAATVAKVPLLVWDAVLPAA